MDENFVVPFLLILSSLDKALIEKPMLVQVGSFCASNAIWHRSATRFRDQVGRKTLDDEHFGCRPEDSLFTQPAP